MLGLGARVVPHNLQLAQPAEGRLVGTAGRLRLIERHDFLVEGARGTLVHVEQHVPHAQHHLG